MSEGCMVTRGARRRAGTLRARSQGKWGSGPSGEAKRVQSDPGLGRDLRGVGMGPTVKPSGTRGPLARP